MSDKPQVVILCGGQGLRLREETQAIPKALVEIGGRPILWHIMKLYAWYGFRDFILCLGYKGPMIREYFHGVEEGWTVTFADTGAETQTGGRLLRVAPHLRGETVLVTYGDGLANVNLHELVAFHRRHGAAATITCVRPESPFGAVEIGADHRVRRFAEKPRLEQWISGGFFVFDRRAFSYVRGDADVLERGPFEAMSAARELAAYRFDGFWACMDTYKDTQRLNELWAGRKAPWQVWAEEPARAPALERC